MKATKGGGVADLIRQITRNVFVETGIVSCNLGIITTEEGVVVIDTPLRPTDALKWKGEVEKKGNVRYVINTEGHPDHATGVYFFGGTYISSKVTREELAKKPASAFTDLVKRNDPAGVPLVRDYHIRLADFAFEKGLDIHLGNLTLKLFELPGHVPGANGVYIPEERVVFTADVIFHKVKTWLQDANPDQWLESLKKVESLDVDFIVPGHGALCEKEYLKEQAAIVRNWRDAVEAAVEQGLTLEQAQKEVVCPDPYQMQPGVLIKAEDVNRMSIANLYAWASKRRIGS
jgi:cyclase